MIRFVNKLLLVVIISLVFGCNSSRKVTSSSKQKTIPKSEKREIVENPIYKESDQYFKKFKKHNPNLNGYTMTYIERYKNIATDKMMKYKIPASITLAQGILESGNGRSTLALKSNNHFGIKCHKGWEGEKVYHDDDRRHECFRKYNNPEGSFDDHSLFLTTRGRYSFLFDIKEDNYKAWAKGLKKAGYATDRKYPAKLIALVEEFHLHQYDKIVLKSKDKSYKPGNYYEPKTDYIIVNKGDTLYSIAKNNNLKVEELKKYNNLRTNNISIGQKLYLGK
jgi:flagellum-specific peptidoglycan hydrolase FlgJ